MIATGVIGAVILACFIRAVVYQVRRRKEGCRGCCGGCPGCGRKKDKEPSR